MVASKKEITMSDALKCYLCDSILRNTTFKKLDRCPACRRQFLHIVEEASVPVFKEARIIGFCDTCNSTISNANSRLYQSCPGCEKGKIIPQLVESVVYTGPTICGRCDKTLSSCKCDRCPYCGTDGSCSCYGYLKGS